MEIKEMNAEELEARLGEIQAAAKEQRDGADFVAMKAEAEEIRAELERRKEQAKRDQEERERIANDESLKGKEVIEEKGNKPMEFAELRKTKEYAGAFLRGMKTNDFAEVRSLLSTNGTNVSESLTGYVPVPELLENEIKTAWEEHELLNLVKKTYMRGNVRVAFELTADGAEVHVEGTDAPDEEEITLGIVEIKAESLKKWITVSDEALEGTTVDTMGYLMKEIAHRITELAEELIIGKIEAAPTTSTASAAAVKEVELAATGLALDTIVQAVAQLSGQAKNLHIAMNRGTRAALVALQMGANYAVDVFDGLKERVVITDKLPNIGDAEEGDTVIVIGDFGYGFQANFPNGEELAIKVDNLSLAEKDLVKLVGREYVGFGVVAENAFVRVVVPDQD